MFNSILITGSAGLIGSHLASKFLLSGYKVIGVDNLIGGYKTNMPIDNNFFYHNVDILDNESLQKVFINHKPDIVVHCAALAHEGLSVFSPKKIVENIYSGTVSVASAAIASGVKLFVNTSSMARYGNITSPFRESDIPKPTDPYGMAKLHAEQQLNLLSDIHGLKVFHVIPHNVCGPHQCYSDPFRNVMSIFANRILHEKPIYIYGEGKQQRSFSHVDDCVRAYVTLINKANDIENLSVFNIGPDDGSEISIKELAFIVSKYFNTQPEIINIPARPREVQHAWVSTEKARQQLDYSINNSTEDTVRDTVLWIKNSERRDFNYHLNLEIINESTPKTWTDKLFNK